MSNNPKSRTWFCVLNNPENVFGDVEPRECVNKAIERWVTGKPQRTCAVNYEIGESGTPHLHMVLEDPSTTRFNYVRKLYDEKIHIEPTRGTKKDAEDYIHKRGKFEEKHTTIVVEPVYYGEIKANSGSRSDLYAIQEMIEMGMTPAEIMDTNIVFRKNETIIRKQFFRKKYKETKPKRDVKVYWHVGNSGTGKSYSYIKLCEKYGEDNVYLYTDYDKGGFDNYMGQPILVLDEFKGEFKFQELLNYLDGYRIDIHCRYSNAYALWTEVHITSVFPPETAYKFMVEESSRKTDSIKQLIRRITEIIYHYKENGEYKTYAIKSSEYKEYETLKQIVEGDKFIECNDDDLPFK